MAFSFMRIRIKTIVNASLETVIDGFDESLFLKLSPPFPPVKLMHFDGCQKDDRVKLELNFILFRQTWESLIVEDHRTQHEFYFVDEGVQLPFFLKTWQHRHVIETTNGKTMILDDIQYATPMKIFDWLMYPALFLQFLYRKPIYKKIFSKK